METRRIEQVYDDAGFGRAAGQGCRPAILVVDFSYGFTDTVYPTAAEMGAEITATRTLLDQARGQAVPVIFTTIAYGAGEAEALAWLRKAGGMAALREGTRLVEIDQRLGRRSDEPLIVKKGASAFFGTGLAALLCALRVDTVVVAGATTSGCVRASVVDAVQSGFNVLVAADCVADRAKAPHDANLFDMAQKYADVVSLADALSYLDGLAASGG
jgi:nicotinamidase-related amidase